MDVVFVSSEKKDDERESPEAGMVQAPVLKLINRHIEAVGLCVRDGLAGPALVLTYVGIDAFGMLGRPVRLASK